MLKTLLIRFGWVVFERSQKVSKTVKKNGFLERHNFWSKNFFGASQPFLLSETKNSDFVRVTFEKSQEV